MSSAPEPTEQAASHEQDPPTLATLPRELLIAILALCDVAGLGRMAATCAALSCVCDDEELWSVQRRKQDLHAPAWVPRTSKSLVRQGMACEHGGRPSSDFEWQPSENPDLRRSRCTDCGRLYSVTLKAGFMDTSFFSSKLVTKAEFQAVHEAPRHQCRFVVIWDRADAPPRT